MLYDTKSLWLLTLEFLVRLGKFSELRVQLFIWPNAKLRKLFISGPIG